MARKQRDPELVSVTLPWHRWDDLAKCCDDIGRRTRDNWFTSAAKTIWERADHQDNVIGPVTVEGREATFTKILNAAMGKGAHAKAAAALLAAELSTAAFGKAG